MSGTGAPQSGARAEGWAAKEWQRLWMERWAHVESARSAPRIAVVATSWHAEVTDALVAGAARTLRHAHACFELFRVPGAFELPIVVQRSLGGTPVDRDASNTYPPDGFDAAVALGVVIRGETPHFDYVCRAATDGLVRVGLDSGKPVGFGLLTCENEAQALDRAGLSGSREDKGAEAAEAALDTLLALMRQ